MKTWPEKCLGELCSLITDGKHGDCRNEEGSGYYFISCKDVKDGRIHYDDARQIVHADFAETHRRTDLTPGDVLLTNSGTIGRLAISDIIRQLHQVVNEAIETKPDGVAEPPAPYDVSKIDFERLRQEFQRSPAKQTATQNLRQAIEQRVQRLLLQNPLRTDYPTLEQHYDSHTSEHRRRPVTHSARIRRRASSSQHRPHLR